VLFKSSNLQMYTLFRRVSCLSSSLCSSSFSGSSTLLSKLKDTELAFFLPLIGMEAASSVVVIFVGAIVIGGTQSEDKTMSASEYTFFDGIGWTTGIVPGLGSRISIPESWHDNLTRDPSSSSGMAFDLAGSACQQQLITCHSLVNFSQFYLCNIPCCRIEI